MNEKPSLIDRLRMPRVQDVITDNYTEAADEIERLRAQLAAAEVSCDELRRQRDDADGRIAGWKKRAEAAEAQLSSARKALEPFANCVFNDNGDVTVSTSNLQIDGYYKAYRFLRSLHPNGEENA